MAIDEHDALEDLKNDCFRLVLVWRALEALMAGFHVDSRTGIALQLTQMKSIENDIVMRLCRFDEPAGERGSFRRARKALQGRRTQQDLDGIDRAIGAFRAAVNGVKVRRRNQEIAHRGNEPEEFSPYAAQMRIIDLNGNQTDRPGEIPALVQQAVALTDLIAGVPIDLSFRPGSTEGPVDLRSPVPAE